jgi:hypothetical protein
VNLEDKNEIIETKDFIIKQLSKEGVEYKYKLQDILGIIEQYGRTDGAHYKQWVLNEIVRIITNCTTTKESDWYLRWTKEHEWDKGIAP